jgi:hypothetical protein
VGTQYVGADVVFIPKPDAAVSVFFRVGAGCRFVELRYASNSEVTGPDVAANLDVTLLGIGVEIHEPRWLRIVPEASLEAGPFAGYASLGVRAYFASVHQGSRSLIASHAEVAEKRLVRA